MATDTQKYAEQMDYEARHSALAEFGRDERRPAVLLLSALVLSALFFGIGLMVGRWTAEPPTPAASSRTPSTTLTPAPSPQPSTSPATNTAGENTSDPARRFALLVATYDAPEKAQTLIKILQEAGYTDVRTINPRTSDARPGYSVLVGHFTQDEASEALRRMRSTNNPRLKNARMVKDSGQ